MIINKRSALRITIFWIVVSYFAAHLCFLFLPGIFESLNARTVDRLFRFRSNSKQLRPIYNDTVVHVDLNNTSIRELNNFYLNRSYHAGVIRNLASMNASAQLYDFIFAAPTNKKEDLELIDGVAGAGNVYLGMAFDLAAPEQSGTKTALKAPDREYLEQTRWHVNPAGDSSTLYSGTDPLITFSALASVSKGLGFLSLKPDPDGVFRRLPLVVRYGNGVYPSFIFRFICDYLEVPPEKIVVKPGRTITLLDARRRGESLPEDILIPIDARGNMVVNFIGPWERMKHYNFVDVYRASDNSDDMVMWRDELSGKIVVISEVSTGSSDVGAVPTDNNFPLSGVHANAVHTILTGDFLRELSPYEMIFIELLLLTFVMGLSFRFSSVLFSIGTIAVAGGYILTAALFFFYANLIFHIVKPLLAVAFAFVSIQIASAFENARTYAEAEKAKRLAERELEIGRQIQSGFFPISLPTHTGWEIAAFFKSARQVAGDFYDAFPLKNGKKIAIVIADVCDKGVGAALFMALVRSLIRAFAIQNFSGPDFGEKSPDDPMHEALRRTVTLTNNYIAETHGDANMFVTLFFGVLDPETGFLSYVNGGHEPPVLVRQTDRAEHLRPTGPAVGMLPDLEFIPKQIRILPGDTLFACTDGVSDAQNPAGNRFTGERLLHLLIRNNLSAEALIDRVRTEVYDHISGAGQYDDVTMIAVRRKPDF